MRLTWNRQKLIQCFGTNELAIDWCKKNGLVPKSKICRWHKTPMKLEGNGQFGRFRCKKGRCRDVNNIPVTKGTWFEGVRLKMPSVFR